MNFQLFGLFFDSRDVTDLEKIKLENPHSLCVRALTFGLFLLASTGFSHAASLSLGPFNQGVYSGTGPFNVTGTCTDPGDDCADNDTRIRTADLIQYSWSIAASNIALGDPDLASVILQQTITPGAGAIIKFDRIPTICLAPPQGTGGTDPLSSITNNPDGSSTLLCNLGSMGNGDQLSFSVPVRPMTSSVNGSTFTTSQHIYALNNAGDKIVPDVAYIDSNNYEISSAPAFDLIGDRLAIYKSYVANYDLGTGSGPEPGYVFYFTAHIAADAERSGKGTEVLGNSFTFTPGIFGTKSDGTTPYSFPYKIVECRPNPSAWGRAVIGRENIRSDYEIEKKVVDSGSCSYSGDSSSGYTMTVTGTDTSGSRYPAKTINNTSLLAGPYFVAAFRMRVWIPFSAIDAEDGVPNDNAGAIKLSSCLSDFDPDSLSGVSNYSGALEPGHNGSAMPDGSASNNCTGPVDAKLSVSGSFGHWLVASVNDNGGYSYQPLVPSYHAGTAVVEPGMTYAHINYLLNRGSANLNNTSQCTIFDNTVSKLTDRGDIGATPGEYAYIANITTGGFDKTQWKIEYGSAILAGDDPLDKDADGQADFNPVSGRYEGNWEQQRVQRCDDPAIVNWQSDPTVIGLENINIVRVVAVDPSTTALQSGQQLRLFIPLQMRDNFNGGPHDAASIPAGTVVAAMSTFRSDEYYPGWRNIRYQPSPESTHNDGDRATFTRILVDVAKSTLAPVAAAGTPGNTLAGNNIVWQLDPVVSSQQPQGGTANNLTVIDTLPQRLSYNDSCTQQQSGGTPPTLVEYNTPNAGETRLSWSLGDVHSTAPITPLIVCTSTDPLSTAGTVVINEAFAIADNSLPSIPAYQSVALAQVGSIQSSVTVDVPLDDPNDSQQYLLRWYNFSTAGSIAKPTIINVLPYNGDNAGLSGRSPASTFSGVLDLAAEPLITFSDGSVPGGAEAVIGVLYYSSDVSSSIGHNPDNNSSNWCEYDGSSFVNPSMGGGVCPSSWSEVTAIKHISNYELETDGNPRQGLVMSYSLNANGNAAGNRYTNVFAIDSVSLPAAQYIKSQQSSVIIASYSIGDFVFVDLNNNGKYDSTVDLPAPNGVTVQLHKASDDSLLASRSTLDGKFLFDLLGQGDYYLKLPVSQFTGGGLLTGWDAAIAHKPANNDANQHLDHSGFVIASAASSGVLTDTITLSAQPPVTVTSAPIGDEPVGDNVLGVSDPKTNDDFSNLTMDIGLVTGDADNDGIPDVVEFGTGGLTTPQDTDNDGTADYLDTDSDNDGIPDNTEAGSSPTTPVDSDNDGTADYQDTDSDNDGLADSVQGSVDTDNDGTPDYLDDDSDGDGIADSLEGGTDTDNDGIANYLDKDSDGDGIADSVEGIIDTDGDSIANYLDTDSDEDGITDKLEGTTDTDSDGLADFIDRDSDGDGVPDALEGSADFDGDGIADYRDLDADNDGLTDFYEADSKALDSDGDGIEDQYDSDATGGTDANGDGIDDGVAANALADTDSDGIADLHDRDSDNDGVTDTAEGGGSDNDGDGQIDGFTDANSDGLNDNTLATPLAVVDTDLDAVADFRDSDSDNDGISDLIEAGGIDLDLDGVVDGWTDNDNDGFDDATTAVPLLLTDTDNDGADDYQDTDSDNDGITDSTEGTADTDLDGVANFLDADSDNDGINDSSEGEDDPDNDGTANYLDTDSDADGIADSTEGEVDTDSDGVSDYLDTDLDDDGIADSIEGVSDVDNDAIPNYLDSDSDADGIADDTEGTVDTDNDGLPNYLDGDSDGDSIADSEEGVLDTDNDGLLNYLDTDSDNDGIADNTEGGGDTDSDGTSDYLDPDSDGDGIADNTEGNTDTDSDGISDYLDSDSDADGIADSTEGSTDTDNDGTPDYLDVDSDGDGIVDSAEGSADTDSDGIPDYLDTDSDGDGIADSTEGGTDTDSDGIPDYLDSDSDADGIADSAEGSTDTDSDGIPDYLDSDSDGDGIADNKEGVTDTDGDSIPDYLDTDSDSDGIADDKEGDADTDGDSIPDYLDIDSDGDGIVDSTEGSIDSDGDGIADYIDIDSDNDGITDDKEGDVDTDGDSIPDYLDIDSDGDGIVDSTEGSTDSDGDGIADYIDIDSDNDGITDDKEGDADTDGDSIPDYLDIDSDGDGIVDSKEGSTDSDGDGIPDYQDTDSDGDGIADNMENTGDTDGDGIPDYLDLDSDNDGVVDADEDPLNDSDADGISDNRDIDADNDGIPDAIEGNGDSDGDGIANYLDLDSDNDGIFDLIEAQADLVIAATIDTNNDGVIDSSFNPGTNGLADFLETGADSAEVNYAPADSDGDGVPDYIDLDSDNDGYTDLIEAAGEDADGNGLIDGFADENGDGLSDALAILPLTVLDSDHDTVADFRDLDSDNDGIPDLVESAGTDADQDGDGLLDGFNDENADGLHDDLLISPIVFIDSDGDGDANHLDIDSDNDGEYDLTEAGGIDSDEDGVVDSMSDVDGDGIPDSVDVDITLGVDADNDGIDDRADVDFIGGADDDGDGISNAKDPDKDGDGFAESGDIPNLGAALPDENGDGVPDFQQAQDGLIETGLSGGGCVFVGMSASLDPVLPMLVLISLIGLMYRRRPGLR